MKDINKYKEIEMDRQVTKTDAGVYTKVDWDQENGIKRDRREFGSRKW